MKKRRGSFFVSRKAKMQTEFLRWFWRMNQKLGRHLLRRAARVLPMQSSESRAAREFGEFGKQGFAADQIGRSEGEPR